MLRRPIALVGILGIVCTSLLAGPVPTVGVPSPGWRAWSMNLDPSPPPRTSGLSQSEFDELLATIDRIGALYRRTPYLQQPADAEIIPGRFILPRVDAAVGEGPVRASFTLSIYRPEYHHRNPNCYFTVYINDPWIHARRIFEDDLGAVFLAWPQLESSNGKQRHRFDQRTVIEQILPAGREPWLPVSQERWIRLLIDRTEKDLEEYLQKLVGDAPERRALMTRHYESSIALAARYLNEPQRFPGVDKETREAMARNTTESAEAMLKTFEENERAYQQVAAALAARDYDALEAAGDPGRAMMGRKMLALRAELAGLSAAERAAPAYGFEYDPVMYLMPRRPPKRPSLLLNAGDPNAFALLAPNPDFFRRDLPAGQIQSITIYNKLWPEFDERLERELDWRSFAAMVR